MKLIQSKNFLKKLKPKDILIINRTFIHILLSLTKEDNLNAKLDYLNILGFNQKGKNYLKKIKKDLNIPLNRNVNSLIFQYELRTSLIYDLINDTNTYNFELKNKPIIKN